MSTAAPQIDQQHDLDEDLRHAWREYYDQLQNLAREEYEQVELAAWAELEGQLARIARRRRLAGIAGN